MTEVNVALPGGTFPRKLTEEEIGEIEIILEDFEALSKWELDFLESLLSADVVTEKMFDKWQEVADGYND